VVLVIYITKTHKRILENQAGRSLRLINSTDWRRIEKSSTMSPSIMRSTTGRRHRVEQWIVIQNMTASTLYFSERPSQNWGGGSGTVLGFVVASPNGFSPLNFWMRLRTDPYISS